MKKLLFVLLCVVVALATGAGVLYWRVWRVQQIARTTPDFVPQQSSVTLQPPTQAIPGTILEYTGSATKIPREGNDPVQLQLNEQVVDGERVITEGAGALTLDFAGMGRVEMVGPAEISLSSALPSAFLIQHRQGTVRYSDVHPEYPLSVRVLQSLIEVENGQLEIELQSARRRVVVRLLAGTARVSMIDAENNTQVVTITGTQQAIINDVQKTITVEE